MIHPKITNDIPRITKLVSGLKAVKQSARINHEDNFVLYATRLIVDEMMQIVIDMSGEELSWNDWWDKGFPKTDRISSHTADHIELVKIGRDTARSIYQQLNRK